MDLKIKDVAELLNISETTVRRWLVDGKIPAYRLNRQYRFSRSEIEDWLIQQKLDAAFQRVTKKGHAKEEASGKHSSNMQFSLYRAIYRGEVLSRCQRPQKRALYFGLWKIWPHGLTSMQGYSQNLFFDREKMMPTTLGHGIGVPHTRDFLLNTHHDVIEVVYPQQPIEYGALDGEPVHTLFFLFACEDKRHLNLLAKLAHLSANEKTRAFFRTKPSKERLLEFIKHWESSLSV